MAHTCAIAAVGNTLRALIEEARPAVFPDARAYLLRPRDIENGYGGLQAQGFGLLLWRVSINTARRTLPPRTGPAGERLKPSLPVDLHYLLACWDTDAESTQLMLGWAMRLFEDNPLLPAGLLNRHAAVAAAFGADEGVEVVCDPLALPDWLGLWDKIKPHFVVGVTYVARAVLLDSDTPLHSYGTVLQREFPLTGGPA